MTENAVQQLLDRDEIARLVSRLAVSLDEGRLADLRAILTEDATARTPGGTAEGLEAVIAQASRNHTPEHRIQHVVTNVLTELDGDRATVRANLIVTFVPRSAALDVHFQMGEVYRFGAVRNGQGWRLSRIETTPVWTSGDPDLARPRAS